MVHIISQKLFRNYSEIGAAWLLVNSIWEIELSSKLKHWLSTHRYVLGNIIWLLRQMIVYHPFWHWFHQFSGSHFEGLKSAGKSLKFTCLFHCVFSWRGFSACLFRMLLSFLDIASDNAMKQAPTSCFLKALTDFCSN